MQESHENPKANNNKQELTPKEEDEITRKWYGHTSFEGRTSAEFNALRNEVRKATTLDFARLRSDKDYARLIYENSLVEEFLAKSSITDLWIIYEERDAIGLSTVEFQKIVAALGPEIQKKWIEEVERHKLLTEAIGGVFRQFTPEEIKEHSNELTVTMKKEIELQEQNVSHKTNKLPLFPKKKDPR